MDILLETKNLSISYHNISGGEKTLVNAVKDVSLKIYKGEIYALAGESGCGKSTLAKSIVTTPPLTTNSAGMVYWPAVSSLSVSSVPPTMTV